MRIFALKTWSDCGMIFLVAENDFEPAVELAKKENPNLHAANFEFVASFDAPEFTSPRYIGRTSLFGRVVT